MKFGRARGLPDADERSRVTAEKRDTASGGQEILARPIGRNELDAIQVCLAFIDMQREYAEESAPYRGKTGSAAYRGY